MQLFMGVGIGQLRGDHWNWLEALISMEMFTKDRGIYEMQNWKAILGAESVETMADLVNGIIAI